MSNIVDELIRLKSAIEEAKTNRAVLKDRVGENLKRLKDEFGLRNIEAANKWLEKTKTDVEKMEKEIQYRFEKLKSEYEW